MIAVYEKYPPLPLKELVEGINSFPNLPRQGKMDFISRIIGIHPTLHIGCILGGNTFRVRNMNGKSIDKMEDILWPPLSQGENNRLGHMYYVATNQHTALAEIDDGKRQVVVMVRYKQEYPCVLYPAGEEDTITRGGIGFIDDAKKRQTLINQLKDLENKDYDAAMAWVMQQAFIAEQCASEDRGLSQHAFSEILAKEKKLEGVVYPSLKRKGGFNLALSPKTFLDNWILESVTKMKVERLPYVFYRMTTLATVTDIDSSGYFTWEDNNGHERMETFLSAKP